MATHSSILTWEMPRTEEPDGPQSMGHIKVGPNRATRNRSISKVHTQVCVCVCVCACVCVCVCVRVVSCLSVCISLSPSCSLSRKLRSLSASVSPDSRPPVRSSGPGLSREPWLWLRSWRREAVSLGVAAGECLCVCRCACLSLVCSLRKVVCLAGGLGARGRGLRRARGGAEALRSTAPLWPPWVWAPGRCRAGWALRARAGLCLGPPEAPSSLADVALLVSNQDMGARLPHSGQQGSGAQHVLPGKIPSW